MGHIQPQACRRWPPAEQPRGSRSVWKSGGEDILTRRLGVAQVYNDSTPGCDAAACRCGPPGQPSQTSRVAEILPCILTIC
jgi:hypothetical protein